MSEIKPTMVEQTAPGTTPQPEQTFPLESSGPLPGDALLDTPEGAGWGGVRSFLKETLETIALTLVIFLVIRAGVQNFRIEGQSMEPNFHDGQYLLVSKVEYLLRTPERGDVVVFMSPQNLQKDFIKRVIGLPGETVEVRDGRVMINGKELANNYMINPASYNFGPAKVGENELFVLGDNRNYSSDSHSWGMLPREHLIGKAWVSYWPPQQWGIIQTPSFADGGASAPQTSPVPTVVLPPTPKAAYP